MKSIKEVNSLKAAALLVSSVMLVTACKSTDDQATSRSMHGRSVAYQQSESDYRSDQYQSQRSAGASTSRTEMGAQGSDVLVIPLHEEDVRIGKETVNAGEVRLRKIVRAERVNEPVTVRREFVEIEKIQGGSRDQFSSRDTLQGAQPFEEKEIVISLQEERPIVEKETFLKGQVVARRNVQSNRMNVERTIRSEDVQIDRSGARENVAIRGNFDNFSSGAAESGQEIGAGASQRHESRSFEERSGQKEDLSLGYEFGEEDRQLEQQISNTLKNDPSVSPSSLQDIRIEAEDGKVKLSGKVSSEQEKQSIASRIQSLSGVRSVDNKLKVE